jgi:hypothetical protein
VEGKLIVELCKKYLLIIFSSLPTGFHCLSIRIVAKINIFMFLKPDYLWLLLPCNPIGQNEIIFKVKLIFRCIYSTKKGETEIRSQKYKKKLVSSRECVLEIFMAHVRDIAIAHE